MTDYMVVAKALRSTRMSLMSTTGMSTPNTRFYTDNFIFGFFGVRKAYPEKAKDKIAGKAGR